MPQDHKWKRISHQDSETDPELNLLGLGHRRGAIVPKLHHAVVSNTVQYAALLGVVGAMTTEDSAFPYLEEEERESKPPQQVPTVAAVNDADCGGQCEPCEHGDEVRQIGQLESALQLVVQGTLFAL